MNLERVIEAFGTAIGKHLVSRRVENKEDGPFKGVKTYKIELWDVESHEIVVSVERTAHITLETKGCIVEALEYGILNKMFQKYAKQNTE